MRYTFANKASLLNDVEVYAEKDGNLKAVLTAPDGADVNKLAKLKTSMERNGFNVIVDTQKDGKDLLRISKVKSADTFLAALAEDGGVFGNYGVEITDREIKEKKSFGDLVKDNALTMAGWSYLIADSLLIGAAVKRGALEPDGDKSELANGILFWIPSFFLIFAGQQDPNIVNGFVKRDFKEDLEKHNIAAPTEILQNLEAGAAGRSLWDKAVELVYKDGPFLNNLFQVSGAVKMFEAGKNQNNLGKMLAGLIMGSGMGLGAILPEKQETNVTHPSLGKSELSNPERLVESNLQFSPGQSQGQLNESLEISNVVAPDKVKKGPGGGINPLFISGAGAFANNVMNIVGAYDEIRQWKHNETWLRQDKLKLNFLAKDKPFLEDKDGLRLQSEQNYKTKLDSFKDIYNKDELRFSNEQNRIRQNEPTLYKDFETRANSTNPMDVIGLDAYQQERYADYRDAKLTLDKSKKEYDDFQKVYDDKQKSVEASGLNLAAQGFYLLANRLYMMSSKENTADLDDIGAVNEIMAMSANIIASHPKEDQAVLTERLATMLNNSRYIDYSIDDISNVLAAKVDALDNNAWLGNPQNNIVGFDRTKATMLDDRGAGAANQDAGDIQNNDFAAEFAKFLASRPPATSVGAQDPAPAMDGRVEEKELAVAGKN